MTTTRRWLAALLLLPLLSGCAVVVPVAGQVQGALAAVMRGSDPQQMVIADTGTGSGSIVSAETMPNLPIQVRLSGVNAARVVYRSVQPGVGEREVSGTVFTPSGEAPEGGWPVISYAHGTTGIEQACAPSRSASLLGASALVQGYTTAGFAVAITDYEGLGHPGNHAYLDNITAGYDVIDAVRALRTVFPDVGTQWAAFGGSQGGGAAWAANELADSYAPELDLVGAVALAPGANMVGLVDKAIAGTLTDDQGPLLQWVLESLARRDPALNLDDYRSGDAAQDWAALTGCTPDKAGAREDAVHRLGDKDFAPKSDAAADALRRALAAMAVPQGPASAPMLVAYGDADTYIDAAWTDAALEQACGYGDIITIDRQAGRGHGDVNGDAVNQWIGDRFAGVPAQNDCT
ncbi:MULTISPECIES: lipase family protein [unclassified Rhodococcus (in: high G+C Gram-positive bacteria)]|uniref:lipase family protein n=1 Tax=unclassified Rhodococcus (in: high G+C Gram-positive bacteria) TaxID=192944 RepID=UPI00211ADD6B|nr:MULTISPECIES: lipase family protein [unclassified Rhodococcus (in: high G+C Gram-positive bacteria)]